MKKIFVIFCCLTAIFFVVSCGSGSKTGNNTDTGDTVNDSDTGDTGSTDTEPGGGDIEPTENPDSDNPDTAPDAGDSAPDNGDSTPDNDSDSTDSTPDSDTGNPANENPSNLPECSPTSTTPCFDPETGLIWSGKSVNMMHWASAVDYCKNLNEGGFNDWRLPGIAVLRTLVKNCDNDSSGCTGDTGGKYSKFGDIVFLWSATGGSSNASGVYFFNGATQSKNVDESFDARCVRRENETRKVNCTGLPENAQWNTVSEITQTWDWDQMWIPSSSGSYNEAASTTECRFKCDQDTYWASNTCNIQGEHYYVSSGFTPEDMVATKEEINNSPDEVNKKLQSKHSTTWNECPTHDWQSNEEYDEAGNLYVVDKCKITMDNELRWLENIVPTWFYNTYTYGMTSPTTYRIVYMQVDYAMKGSPSNVKIRQPFIIYDIDLTSANCLGQATEDTSVITATPMSGAMTGCLLDNMGHITGPIQTKNVKQTRDSSAQDIALCATMPNHQYDEETNTCYTTVEEFGWVENIPHKLLNKKGFSWKTNGYRVNRIERHLDTNTFYMDIQMKNMNIHVELPNAKSCMLQCQGQEGCTVHIEPSPDASKGCFVNGAEVEE